LIGNKTSEKENRANIDKKNENNRKQLDARRDEYKIVDI
jgi:hypothetical protein